MKPYILHSQAAEEYAEAISYHARINTELGERFVAEMDELIGEVCRDPERYREVQVGVRRHFSDVFPYAVFYINQLNRVWIVAVMHMSRRPDYWRSRLN